MAKKKIVKFTRTVGTYNVGDVAGFRTKQADFFIVQGVAISYSKEDRARDIKKRSKENDDNAVGAQA